MASPDPHRRLLRSLRLWRAAALLLAVALVVAVVVNRRQAAALRQIAGAEVRKEAEYDRIVAEVEEAFGMREGGQTIMVEDFQRMRLQDEAERDEALP